MTQPPPPGYPPQQPPAGQPPNNNLVIAIIGLLFCWPPGIYAIVKATQVSSLWAQGQYAEAQAAADDAKKWGIWSIIGGAVLLVFIVIIQIIGAVAATSEAAAMITSTLF